MMTFDQFLALLAFAAICSWTPGPNNTILMASGIAHGFRKTLPMVFGVCIGFPTMIALVGAGLGQVFEAAPQLYTILKFAGAAYMLWLAWKIATSIPADSANTNAAKPLSFLQGAAFQWINPKAWIMSVTALSTYTTPDAYTQSVAIVVASFAAAGFTSSIGWASFGTALRQVMTNPKWFRAINIALAISLVLSLVPMLR
jgi:threonine/homoserine/homoserine lactone efflux protein